MIQLRGKGLKEEDETNENETRGGRKHVPLWRPLNRHVRAGERVFWLRSLQKHIVEPGVTVFVNRILSNLQRCEKPLPTVSRRALLLREVLVNEGSRRAPPSMQKTRQSHADPRFHQTPSQVLTPGPVSTDRQTDASRSTPPSVYSVLGTSA